MDEDNSLPRTVIALSFDVQEHPDGTVTLRFIPEGFRATEAIVMPKGKTFLGDDTVRIKLTPNPNPLPDHIRAIRAQEAAEDGRLPRG